MVVRHAWLAAHVVWLIAWLTLDLLWGGLIAADFSTAGLQQAYMFVLYPLGVILLLLLWASVRAIGAIKRRFAKPS